MNDSMNKSIQASTIIAVIAIIAMAICNLAALKYNTSISIEKEKIEVSANNSNQLGN